MKPFSKAVPMLARCPPLALQNARFDTMHNFMKHNVCRGCCLWQLTPLFPVGLLITLFRCRGPFFFLFAVSRDVVALAVALSCLQVWLQGDRTCEIIVVFLIAVDVQWSVGTVEGASPYDFHLSISSPSPWHASYDVFALHHDIVSSTFRVFVRPESRSLEKHCRSIAGSQSMFFFSSSSCSAGPAISKHPVRAGAINPFSFDRLSFKGPSLYAFAGWRPERQCAYPAGAFSLCTRSGWFLDRYANHVMYLTVLSLCVLVGYVSASAVFSVIILPASFIQGIRSVHL